MAQRHSEASTNAETVKMAPEAALGVDEVGDDVSSSRLQKHLTKRYWPVLLVTWMVHIGLGLCMSVTGPTLPYLALNTGETLARVSGLYTARSVSVCVTSLTVGVLLTPRLKSSRARLLQLLAGCLLVAVSAFLMPFARSLVTLVFSQSLFGIGVGVLETVDNMLVIYLFGPVLSRSFSHSLHFCIGLGAFLAPLLARPFLIRMGDIVDTDMTAAVCVGAAANSSGTSPPNVTTPAAVSLEPLKWPFITIGCLLALLVVGYAALLLARFKLTRFSPGTTLSADTLSSTPPQRRMSRRRQAVVVALFVLFYVLHVGQENTFWSHLYSFGVCSQRLRMSPAEASLLSTVFFVGFLASRGLGIAVARLLRPSTILVVQLLGCLVTTTVLAVWAEASSAVAYVGSGLYGFCIAMVFPTGITWLASKMDVTGALSSAWFLGAYVGLSTYPLAAGQLFLAPAGAISIMYMAAVTSAVYIAVVAVMFIVAK